MVFSNRDFQVKAFPCGIPIYFPQNHQKSQAKWFEEGLRQGKEFFSFVF